MSWTGIVRSGWRPLVVSLALLALQSGPVAHAQPSDRLVASLTPERLGRATSIGIAIEFDAPHGKVPPPLERIDVRYPNNLGLALSGLGIETCTPSALEALGPAGCPIDSVMGYGSALGEIPFGPEIIKEPATVTILRAADQNGEIALLLDVQGISPVTANLVLSAVLLPTGPPYGGDISISVPPVPSLPEGPDVSVAALRATIGPKAGLTYYERRGSTTVPYVPRGVPPASELPARRLSLRRDGALPRRIERNRSRQGALPARQTKPAFLETSPLSRGGPSDDDRQRDN